MRNTNLIAMLALLTGCVLFTANVQAAPGPAPDGSAIAEYDPETGKIIVSVKGVNNWFVFSDSAGLTGASPQPPLPLMGGNVTDDDSTIGETKFSLFEYTDVDWGLVAVTALPLGDLKMGWNTGFGTPIMNGPVYYVGQGLTGDYDGDNDVDGNDFLKWQRDDGSASGLSDWQNNFGQIQAVASLSAVPEPASFLMVVLGGLALTARRRQG